MSVPFPIRDASDTSIMRAAAACDADVICTFDADFYTLEVASLCAAMGMTVLDDVSLLRRLRP